jgi:glycine/D-amino acid oxidase-like deaminating enzyme
MSARGRAFERGAMLDALRSSTEPFDVLVIGGGITGVGVALDAASRGLRTALVERDDFASGTSSKSSKMVHGGLRYLQNGDVRLVYEALRERRRLMRNAPHLVDVLPFMIPILTKDGVVSKKVAKALGSAMWMYDLTGGWRIGKLHRRMSGDEAARHFPTTHLDKLSAGYLYFDAAADDARLTLTIARTAAEHGAVVVNRCGVVDITSDADGRADGAIVEADGERITVRARCVVNAAGVWADEVRTLDEGSDPGLDPAGQGRARHDPVGEGAQRHRRDHPGAQRQAQPVPRAVGPAARRHVPSRLRRHDRHRLERAARRPAVHRRRHRLRADGAERGTHRDRHQRRHHRRVGRHAPPGQGRLRRRHRRQDRRPVPPPPGRRQRVRGRAHQRGQAHHLPRDGRTHRRPRRRAARRTVGRPDVRVPAGSPCSVPAAGRAPLPVRWRRTWSDGSAPRPTRSGR